MSIAPFFSMPANIFNTVVPFLATLFIHSTVIISVGLLGKKLFESKGSLVQSYYLRVCLVTVFLYPVLPYILNKSGVEKYFSNMTRNIYLRSDFSRLQKAKSESVKTTGYKKIEKAR